LIASEITKELELLGGLDAFSDDAQAQAVRQGNDRAHDRDIVGIHH
jgi:hypothetical protein